MKWAVGATLGITLAGALWFAFRLQDNPQETLARLRAPTTTIQVGEEWTGLRLNTARVGWIHTQKSKTERGYHFEVTSELHLLKSAPVEMTMAAQLSTTGHLETFAFTVEAGTAVLAGTGTVTPKGLALTVHSGGAATQHLLPFTAPLMLRDTVGPQLVLQGLHTGEVSLFNPITQRIQKAAITVLKPAEVVVLGALLPATHIRLTVAGDPLDGWINPRGEMLRQELGLGLVAVRDTEFRAIQRSEKPTDLRAITRIRVAGLPADLTDRTVLRLRVGGVDQARLRLDDERQTLTDAVLTVRQESPSRAGLPLPVTDGPGLAAEPLIQKDHPAIVRAAQTALGDATDTATGARRLMHWVHAHVNEAVSPGVPSALEVLQTQAGDCNEHAVLFAALARAVGIPTQVELGLVWHTGYFRWHAWNRVRVTGGWLTVDPTWAQSPVDVGHLRWGSDGPETQAALLRALGQLTLHRLAP